MRDILPRLMRMRAVALSVIFTISLAWGKPSAAGQTSDHDPEKNKFVLKKGATAYGLFGGAGFAHRILGGAANRQFLSLGGRIGIISNDAKGRGLLPGNLEISLEVIPVFLMFQEKTTYAGAMTLLLRHYFSPVARWKPFFTLGAGALFSADDIPIDTTRLNFTPQAGGGVAYFSRPGLAYLFEYRLHHISNGGFTNRNPGVNSSYFQVGVTLFR